jgi:predicted metal-dependent phosphotriesterase family hydrolase
MVTNTPVPGPRVVSTALGQVAADELGPTLTHEHLFINMMRERRGDGLLHDAEVMTEELAAFRAQGGATVWDLTTAELTPGSVPDADPGFTATVPGQTRDPASIRAVQAVSRATGVHVVLGTGRYRDPYLDRGLVDRLGVAGLAEEMVHDLTVGFGDGDVRAGLIGEVGSDAWYVSATEERVLRAAARAHHETGAAIYTHAARWEVGLAQLDLLAECGVDLRRVAVGHVDTVPSDDFALRVAERGAFVGLDTLYSLKGIPRTARRLTSLLERGYGGQVLLSHDVCVASQLTRNGGPGFTAVLGPLRTQVLADGVPAEVFDAMLTANPVRLLLGAC